MSTTQTAQERVERFNPYINDRCETHLEFTVYYETSDGRTRWATGVMEWNGYTEAAAVQRDVLALQTAFVRQQWLRIEVCVPNRDHYGHLRPGYIKDTGLFLATRRLH